MAKTCPKIADVRNEENVIEPHKHVKHDNFENFSKSLEIT